MGLANSLRSWSPGLLLRLALLLLPRLQLPCHLRVLLLLPLLLLPLMCALLLLRLQPAGHLGVAILLRMRRIRSRSRRRLESARWSTREAELGDDDDGGSDVRTRAPSRSSLRRFLDAAWKSTQRGRPSTDRSTKAADGTRLSGMLEHDSMYFLAVL